MRFLAYALVAVAALSFVSLTAEPAQAVGICADESGNNNNADLYNNMGWRSSTDCDGIVCYGYGQYGWDTCVPPTIYCVTDPCPVMASSAALTLCTTGDLYNNAVGPSSGCDGAVCTDYSNGDWGTCVLDCTADGCPRVEDPCRYLMCQPPFDP